MDGFMKEYLNFKQKKGENVIPTFLI
ncbi:MAG: hypothetical protein ACJASM_002515, partial [Salibacteraceae bacterium]